MSYWDEIKNLENNLRTIYYTVTNKIDILGYQKNTIKPTWEEKNESFQLEKEDWTLSSDRSIFSEKVEDGRGLWFQESSFFFLVKNHISKLK